MDARTIPRLYVSTVLTALRGPVDIAEKLLWRSEELRPWPPRIAFEVFEANAKALAGAVLNDQVLIDEGRRQQAKVAELRRAAELEAYADQTRERADEEFEARRKDNQRRIEAAAAQEKEQNEAAEKQAAERKTAAKKRATSEARAASEVEKSVHQSLQRQERDARLDAISKERRAIAEKRSAVAAEELADQVDAKIEQSRTARRSRS